MRPDSLKTDTPASEILRSLSVSLVSTALPIATARAVGAVNALSVGMVATGIIVGPSAGQFLAQSSLGGTLAIGGRFVGAGLLVSGFRKWLDYSRCEDYNHEAEDDFRDCDQGLAEGLVLSGTLLFIGSTLYSLMDIPLAVQRKQRRQSALAQGRWIPSLRRKAEGDWETSLNWNLAF